MELETVTDLLNQIEDETVRERLLSHMTIVANREYERGQTDMLRRVLDVHKSNG